MKNTAAPSTELDSNAVVVTDPELAAAHLKQAQDDFAVLQRSGELPSDFRFLDDVKLKELSGLGLNEAAFSEYLSARYSDRINYETYHGVKVRTLAVSPLNEAALGGPAGDMIFYRGSMTTDRLSNLRIYAHEVLHRNPNFALQYYRATNYQQIEAMHQQMAIVINSVQLPKSGQ